MNVKQTLYQRSHITKLGLFCLLGFLFVCLFFVFVCECVCVCGFGVWVCACIVLFFEMASLCIPGRLRLHYNPKS